MALYPVSFQKRIQGQSSFVMSKSDKNDDNADMTASSMANGYSGATRGVSGDILGELKMRV